MKIYVKGFGGKEIGYFDIAYINWIAAAVWIGIGFLLGYIAFKA
jgi:hypothetical protein